MREESFVFLPLNEEEQKRVNRAFELALFLWLGGMILSFLLVLSGLYLTRKFPFSHPLPSFFNVLSFFLSALILAFTKFLFEAFMDSERVRKMELDTYLANYVFAHGLAFLLLEFLLFLGCLYTYFSSAEQNLGIFMALSFLGFVLFLPRKSDLLARFFRKRG